MTLDLSRRAGISCLAKPLGVFNSCCCLHTYYHVLVHADRTSPWQLHCSLCAMGYMHYFLNLLNPPNSEQAANILPFIFICLFACLFEAGLAMHPSWPGMCDSSASASPELGYMYEPPCLALRCLLCGGGNRLCKSSAQCHSAGQGQQQGVSEGLLRQSPPSAMTLSLPSNDLSFKRWD